MKKYLKAVLVLFIFSSIILPAHVLYAVGVATPTILKFENNRIIGLAHANSEVMMYIDGVYEGNADMGTTKTETNSFVYNLPKNLKAGEHKIAAIAKDRTSLLLSLFSESFTFYIKNVPAPTMIQPNKNTITERVKPFITGLTESGTKVYFFIDGKLNGQTEFLNHKSGTANFAYRPFLNLKPGAHTAWTIAEDKNGRKSTPSNVLYFNIEKPLPRAHLFSPVVNQHTNIYQPFIVGLAKNDLKVRVFIDHKLNGEFQVKNHKSGTANFAYHPFAKLSPGKHLVYATTIDSRGKESLWSNLVYFSVPGEKQKVKIVKEIKKETKKTEPKENKDAEKKESKIIEKQKETKKEEIKKETKNEEKLDIDKDAQEIILHETEENKDEGGLANENQEKQTALKLNLIIFLAFLLAIILWIFWVNRELIKEKKEESEEESKEEKNK